jgi:YidC/Oxa1 family membrane protein insertase
MEKRAIIAFGLSALLLFAYMWVQDAYFTPPAPPPAAEAPAAKPTPAPATPGTRPAPLPAPPGGAAPAAEAATRPRPPQRIARVETPTYHAVVSSEGGKLLEWTLKYRGEKPLVGVGEAGPSGLLVGADGRPPEPVPMVLEPEALTLTAERPTGELVLRGEIEGLVVRETVRFNAHTYTVDVKVRVENRSGAPRSAVVSLPWTTRQQWSADAERFIGQRPTEVVWAAKGAVGRIQDLSKVPAQELQGNWVGLGSVWYLAALLPRSGGFGIAMSSEPVPETLLGKKETAGRVTVEARATPTIAPGQAWEGDVAVFVGPKEYELLKALGLEGTLDFGGFPVPRSWGGLPMEWIGVPILLLMKWVYGYVGNYGVAIILLTIVSKVLFYPLTVKSMRSMKAMQALQPQVNALRTKYKSEPQRAQQEMMALYRKHKVNPMGGCLPMVAQVPVFYALYLALSVSVELQNAGFLCFGRVFGVELWICDLASHDPTYVLPILMGVTMFVQQKMTPTMGDPRQAKMMLVMPFVFTFMFLNLPSGLVLYWTVSNVLQIAQQWYMDRAGARTQAREVKNARA